MGEMNFQDLLIFIRILFPPHNTQPRNLIEPPQKIDSRQDVLLLKGFSFYSPNISLVIVAKALHLCLIIALDCRMSMVYLNVVMIFEKRLHLKVPSDDPSMMLVEQLCTVSQSSTSHEPTKSFCLSVGHCPQIFIGLPDLVLTFAVLFNFRFLKIKKFVVELF